MDKKDRDLLKNLNKQRIENFGIYIGKANAAKAVLDTKLANLASREVNDMYTQSWKDGEIAKANQAYSNELALIHDRDILPGLTTLESGLLEQHDYFDASDPVWQGTVDMFEKGGKDTSMDTARRLVKPWEHDQAALEALQPIIKRSGSMYDGGIEKGIDGKGNGMRYNIPQSMREAKEMARDTFISKNTSVFKFGVELGKVARHEGVDVPWSEPFPSMAGEPKARDLGSATDAARKAAGLPPEGPKGPEGK